MSSYGSQAPGIADTISGNANKLNSGNKQNNNGNNKKDKKPKGNSVDYSKATGGFMDKYGNIWRKAPIMEIQS